MTGTSYCPKVTHFLHKSYRLAYQVRIFLYFYGKYENDMPTIVLTEQELAIREQLIKAASEGKTVYYSDLVEGEDIFLARSLGMVLENITQYDIENNQPILASIVILKSTGLPSEGFFELCDTLKLNSYLSDLQKECFEWWGNSLNLGGVMP